MTIDLVGSDIFSGTMDQASGDFVKTDEKPPKKPFYYEGIDEISKVLSEEERRLDRLERRQRCLEADLYELRQHVRQERTLYRKIIDEAINQQVAECSECVKIADQPPIDILSFDAGKIHCFHLFSSPTIAPSCRKYSNSTQGSHRWALTSFKWGIIRSNQNSQ